MQTLKGRGRCNSKYSLIALLLEITATEYRRSITSFYNNHFTLEDLDEQQVVTMNSSYWGKIYNNWMKVIVS